jgi:FkbM family methyltransferase
MIRKLHSAWIWRLLHAVLPIEQRLNPLLRLVYGSEGLLRVPWGKYWLTMSAAWLAMGSSGVYTLDFRQFSRAAIMAFEPDPGMFALLSETLAFNAIPDVSALNLACGDRNGRLNFNGGINGAIAATNEPGEAITVPVVRLDDRLADAGPISLIKIDCEGYEWNVLSGCRDIIRAHRPLLFVELHPKLIGKYAHSLQDVCDFLRANYDLSFWDFRPLQRSAHRALRFLSRYGAGLTPIAGESEMRSIANREPRPDQLFLLALPK